MTSIDDKIKQALSDEYNDIISENEKIDANPFKQMSVGFKGKMGWMYIAVIVFGAIVTAMSIYSIYSFYHETEIKPLIGWGVAIIISILLTQITKVWYWSELSSNRVIREIKILELQLAQVIKNQEKQ
ncbi:MAG: hypothetical protein L3J53_03470 [Proteobacteria bacterium]|nr:hypothetical protein [Pseudomonadota bacterium]